MVRLHNFDEVRCDHLHIQGPIIRINPFEVHIGDPEYYEIVYAPSSFSKWTWFENRFNIPQSTFSTADYKVHKPQRAALAPFFYRTKDAGPRTFRPESCVQGLLSI